MEPFTMPVHARFDRRRRRRGSGPGGVSDFFDMYTRDLKADDLRRLFTRDTRDAYQFFARHIDFTKLVGLPWHRRALLHVRLFAVAFAMKLSPARRAVLGVAFVAVLIGLLELFNGFGMARGGFGVRVPAPLFVNGTGWLICAFALMNLLVLLEVADRLTLKNDLEVARDIQLAMLPGGTYRAPGVEIAGLTRPANTVGGDFYDVLPLRDGRLVIALGDVAGKGSPAALLMALLLAMLRTLVQLVEEERIDAAELAARLNVQVCRQAPSSRFITLFVAIYEPATGELHYVNAGHTSPLVARADGTCERLTEGGIALGMFERSGYRSGSAVLDVGDLLVAFSDGITEAEDATGQPFDDDGLEAAIQAARHGEVADIGPHILRTVEAHCGDVRVADDLTVLLLRRSAAEAPMAAEAAPEDLVQSVTA
jgi:sigma-B regulation protein RsbU (phosphoserine phosphatase)